MFKYPLDGILLIADGINVPVDLTKLIERIYVAASTPNWFADLVKALVVKYGYNFEVVHSRLDDTPAF